jgi:hypothetical protein
LVNIYIINYPAYLANNNNHPQGDKMVRCVISLPEDDYYYYPKHAAELSNMFTPTGAQLIGNTYIFFTCNHCAENLRYQIMSIFYIFKCHNVILHFSRRS